MYGLNVEHKSFTLASSLHSHNIIFFKTFNVITERLRRRLGLNFFRYLGLKLWSSFPENLKHLKINKLKYSYKKILFFECLVLCECFILTGVKQL